MKTFANVLHDLLGRLRSSRGGQFVPPASPRSAPAPPRPAPVSAPTLARARLAAADPARLYRARACGWGGPEAYVPPAPLAASNRSRRPVGALAAPAAIPAVPPVHAPAIVPTRPVPKRRPRGGWTVVPTASEEELRQLRSHRSRADCRTLIDRSADDEHGTRVFRVFD